MDSTTIFHLGNIPERFANHLLWDGCLVTKIQIQTLNTILEEAGAKFRIQTHKEYLDEMRETKDKNLTDEEFDKKHREFDRSRVSFSYNEDGNDLDFSAAFDSLDEVLGVHVLDIKWTMNGEWAELKFVNNDKESIDIHKNQRKDNAFFGTGDTIAITDKNGECLEGIVMRVDIKKQGKGIHPIIDLKLTKGNGQVGKQASIWVDNIKSVEIIKFQGE